MSLGKFPDFLLNFPGIKMNGEENHSYSFNSFRLDVGERRLFHNEVPVSMEPKVFDVLAALVERSGHLVEKDELLRVVWSDSFVEETNIARCVYTLRKVLGEERGGLKFIETVAKKGYRFVAEVNETVNDSGLNNGAEQTFSQPIEKTSVGSQRFIKFLAPAVAVLLISLIVTAFWYAGNKTLNAAAPVLSAPFAAEKLSTNGKVFHAVVSPDGKNVVYTNKAGGKESVWLRQLESANNVEIIPASDNLYFGLAFSPDGNFLYFARRPKLVEGQADIYRVSIFGGVPTKIISEAQGWISVSPNGEKLSFVRCYYREDENCSLWIADSSDGKNEKQIASRPRPFRIGDNEFSPDGKTVAFAVGQSENQANEFGLVEVDIESGAERELTAQKFFNIKSVAWLPNQSSLLITASRVPNKTFPVWQVSAASGETQPLTKDSENYFTLSLNKNADVLVSTQVKEDFRLSFYNTENSSAAPRVLADAGTVAFAPNGKIIFSSVMTGNEEIWSINADGSEHRQLTNDAADEIMPVGSPADNSIFFMSNRTGAAHVWRMNADGSNQTQITQKEGGFPLSVSSDGKWLYYHHNLHRTLWRVLTDGGDEQLVFNKRKNHFAVSPDGLRIAFSEKQGAENLLMIISLSEGKTAKTFKLADKKAKLLELEWSPDGENLAYILADSEFENNTLWFQPLDGGTPRQIADLGDEQISETSGFALAPDGKSFAVVQGGWKHDAVVLKGLK